MTDGHVYLRGADRIAIVLLAEAHDVAHRDRALRLELTNLLGELLESRGPVRGCDRGLVDLGVEADGLGGLRLLVASEDLLAVVGVGVELGEADAALFGGGERLGMED